jgi:hypothetical protein
MDLFGIFRRRGFCQSFLSAFILEPDATFQYEAGRIPGWVRISAIVSSAETIPESYTYEVMDGEILEDGELIIPGETDLDCSVGEADEIQDEVPAPLLNDFTIYDMSTNIIVLIAELLMLGCGVLGRKHHGASGITKAWTDAEDEDEEDLDNKDENELSGAPVSTMGERVKFTEILTFGIHHYSEGGNL